MEQNTIMKHQGSVSQYNHLVCLQPSPEHPTNL